MTSISDFYKGDTLDVPIDQFLDDQEAAIDISGHSLIITFKLKKSDSDSIALFQKQIIFPANADSTNGTYTLNLTADETKTLPAKTVFYDIRYIVQGSPDIVETLVNDKVRVFENISDLGDTTFTPVLSVNSRTITGEQIEDLLDDRYGSNDWRASNALTGNEIVDLLDTAIGHTEWQHEDSGGRENEIIVKTAADLENIDSTKEYFIDGIIDMGSTPIVIPADGIKIRGYDPNISQLISSEDNYTMFTSAVGGAGSILFINISLETSGTDSKVYDLVGATGFESIEVEQLNYNNCTSLGTINTYRQGLELNTGRFGGTPELELSGTWVGGFKIETSIVRNLDDGAYTLFKAGTGFSMQSRFASNKNADLPSQVSLFDFAPSNFTNGSTVQLIDCLISRNGSFDPSDSNIIPNLPETDVVSLFLGNTGFRNTYPGGLLTLTEETQTTISTLGEFYPISGTWTASDLAHFDSPNNGELRHIGISPVEFKVIVDLIIDGSPNREITVRLRKFDFANDTTVTILEKTRPINNFQGGNDVAFISFISSLELLENDYIFLEMANITDTSNLRLETESFLRVDAR